MPDLQPSTGIEWRELAEFPGYRFGSDGSIESAWKLDHRGPRGCFAAIDPGGWRPLKQPIDRRGYPRLRLRHISGKMVHRLSHRFILEAFRGPRPERMDACHNDGDKTNNRIENLRWDTRSANVWDSIRHGTYHPPQARRMQGEDHPRAKLSESQVREIRRLLRAGHSPIELATSCRLSIQHVRRIGYRQTWRHVPDD